MFYFLYTYGPLFCTFFVKNATHFARDRDALMIGGSSAEGFKMRKNGHFCAERPLRGPERGA
jgi:hypothetical protein